jgi:hypothetical protein
VSLFLFDKSPIPINAPSRRRWRLSCHTNHYAVNLNQGLLKCYDVDHNTQWLCRSSMRPAPGVRFRSSLDFLERVDGKVRKSKSRGSDQTGQFVQKNFRTETTDVDRRYLVVDIQLGQHGSAQREEECRPYNEAGIMRCHYTAIGRLQHWRTVIGPRRSNNRRSDKSELHFIVSLTLVD